MKPELIGRISWFVALCSCVSVEPSNEPVEEPHALIEEGRKHAAESALLCFQMPENEKQKTLGSGVSMHLLHQRFFYRLNPPHQRLHAVVSS
jgi:hypothetical protein